MIKINIELDYNGDSHDMTLLALKEISETVDSIDDLFIVKIGTKVIEDNEED